MSKWLQNVLRLLLLVAPVAYFDLPTDAQTPQAEINHARRPDPPAPQFELRDLTGKTVHLSDFRGKAVVLNFWATWCATCIVEMPTLMKFQQQYAADGLAVIGISLDEDKPTSKIAGLTRKLGIKYTILLGDANIALRYGNITDVPITFFISRDGLLVDRTFGEIDEKMTESLIKKLLDKSALSTLEQH
jgi:peroxiredoxin